MKKTIYFLLVCSMIMLLSGCNKTPTPEETTQEVTESVVTETPAPVETEEPEENSLDALYKNNPAYKVVKEIYSCLVAGDTKGIVNKIALPENSVVNGENFKNYLANNDLEPLVGDKSAKLIRFKDESDHVEAAIADDDLVWSFTLQKIAGEWKMVLPEIYAEGVKVMAPGGVTIVLNDVPLDPKYAKYCQETNDGRVIYTLSMPFDTMTAKIKSDYFGEYTASLKRRSSTEIAEYTLTGSVPEEVNNAAMEGFRTVLNQLISEGFLKKAVNNEYTFDRDDLKSKYFADSCDEQLITDFITLINVARTSGKTITNVYVTEVVPWQASFICSNNVIVLNVGYEIAWNINPKTENINPSAQTTETTTETTTEESPEEVSEKTAEEVTEETSAVEESTQETETGDEFNNELPVYRTSRHYCSVYLEKQEDGTYKIIKGNFFTADSFDETVEQYPFNQKDFSFAGYKIKEATKPDTTEEQQETTQTTESHGIAG